MLAVTIDHLPGFEITTVIGEVVGSSARQSNAFAEGVVTLSGRFNPAVPALLRRGREDAVARMVATAHRRGANAVVGMRFDHRDIGGHWTEICAYGTAVFVVPMAK